MEPVEINAGSYYLRQLRADDRIDDRPALLAAFADPAMQRALPGHAVRTTEDATGYIDACAAGWRDDRSYAWGVAEPTTGALIGEVRLDLGSAETAELTAWTHPDARRGGVATTAVGTVVRFGFGALGLTRVDATCGAGDVAAAALAERCGFSRDGDDDPDTLRWTRRG